MDVLALLRKRFMNALSELEIDDASLAELILPSQDSRFGDYQANCAMPLGKRLGQPARDVAAAIVDHLDISDCCDRPEVAGPGFINLKLREEWINAQLQYANEDEERLGVPPTDTPQTIVLDYSSPNVAKPMHVGHIRSTVIGDALYRILSFLGHETISDNHLGDWGTQFGMIIFGYQHFVDSAALAENGVQELGRLYKLVNQLVEYHDIRNNKLGRLEDEIKEVAERTAELISPSIPSMKYSFGIPTFNPFIPSFKPAVKSGTLISTDVESNLSLPEIILSMIAASSTVLVTGPAWSREEANAIIP